MTLQTQTTNFIDGLTSAARENPLAAALIGGGALWLLMGNSVARGAAAAYADAVKPAAEVGLRSLKDAATATSRAGADTMSGLADRGRAAVSEFQDGLSETAGSLKVTAAGVVDRASDVLRSTPNPLPALSERYGDARAALTDLLERQPLVLGALGLAIGAGIAGALASTRSETEWAGAASDALTGSIRGRTNEIAHAVNDAAQDLSGQVRAAASASFDKLRKIGEDATKSVAEIVR